MNAEELLFKVNRRLRLFSFDMQLNVNRHMLSGRKNAIKAYQVRFTNFGDMLTPLLLKYYGIIAVPSVPKDAELFCTGSILEKVDKNFSGFILGSGLLRDQALEFERAKILAVRGELTRERINAPKSTALGDPGILVDRLLRFRQQKKYKIGFVPHYEDKNDQRLIEIHRKNPDQTIVIDVQMEPAWVIRKIDQCEFILSSSLHGLITADSLGIPSCWIKLSDKLIGGDFKFLDYATSTDRHMEPVCLEGTESVDKLVLATHEVCKNTEMLKNRLDAVFEQFREELTRTER